jgi:integrase/recombinase XerD
MGVVIRSKRDFMLFEELLESFLYSRKHGVSGAKGKATAKTIETYRLSLSRSFIRFMQEKRRKSKFSDLNRNDIRAFVEYVTDHPKWSPATKLTYMRSVRVFLRWVESDEDCVKDGLHEKNLARLLPSIPQNPRREYIPTPVDLKKWRSGFNTNYVFGYRDYVVFSLMLTTGMRIGEICWLKLEHLQLDNRLVYVPAEGKTGSRLVPITNQMVSLLKGWLRRRDECKQSKTSNFVFISKYDPQCTPNGFDQRFRKVKEKHNLPRVTPHTVRHAFCTYYLRNGGKIERLRNITGHSSYEMLKNYLHLAEVGSDQAKEELEESSPLKMLDEVRAK